jgi:hypothetical protein
LAAFTTEIVGHIQVIDGDRLTLEAEIALMDTPVKQLKCHKCPQVIDLIQVVVINLGNMEIGPIDRSAEVILVGK